MMRGLTIAMCVLSLIYIIVAFGFVEAVSDARYEEWSARYNDYNGGYYDNYSDPYSDNYGYSNGDIYEDEADDITQTAGVVSVIFMLFSLAVFVLALMKIKTSTMKVLSIIGLSISGIFLLWGFLPMTSPGGVSFDEVGPAFGLAGLVLLAFYIVGVIHAFRTSA